MASQKRPEKAPALKLAMQTDSDYQSCASRLKALADPDRLQIVTHLMGCHKSVSALADELGMPVDKVSHHLGVLRAAKLVETQRQGKFVIYSLPEAVAPESTNGSGGQTIDLGCCQIDLVQPKLPHNRSADVARSKRP